MTKRPTVTISPIDKVIADANTLRLALSDAKLQLKAFTEELGAKARRIDELVELRRTADALTAAADQRAKKAQDQFADLKQRLLTAEQQNQFMRGYIARLQEDDVVREDLIPVGDPEGEQQLVPKRRHTGFSPPNDFTSPATKSGSVYSNEFIRNSMSGEERAKRRHWITY